MSGNRRSPYWPLLVPAAALLAAGGRLAMQGSVKLYTEPAKQFYLPDPDLGWRLGSEPYHWLGLDRIAAIVGLAGFMLVVALVISRRERTRKTYMKRARVGLWVASPLALVVPLLAFLGGSPPSSARAEAPGVGDVVTAGFTAALPSAPAGKYEVIEHPGSVISASIKAGGDIFEATFSGNMRGTWSGDPGRLGPSMIGEVVVASGSIKTGIDLRNRHASDALEVKAFPELGFRLTSITGTAATDAANKIQFTGAGVVIILGKEIPTTVTGAVTELDAVGRERLGLETSAALVVSASMSIRISETPIDAGDTFDIDTVPIKVSLVLTHKGAKS